VNTGFFGGSFNPVHTAHLIIAEWIRNELDIKTLYFIPTANPPHKTSDKSIIDISLRREMVSLAIKDNPNFKLADHESKTEEVSYSVDTVRRFLQEKSLVSNELYFIIGEDNLRGLPTWKDPVELSRLCSIVVARRSLDTSLDLPQGMKPPHQLKTPNIEISASGIRKRIRKNQSIKYLVPEAVEKFIKEHTLYEEDNGQNDPH